MLFSKCPRVELTSITNERLKDMVGLVGRFENPIESGESLKIFSLSGKWLKTSPLKSYEETDGLIKVYTMNSVYEFKVLAK